MNKFIISAIVSIITIAAQAQGPTEYGIIVNGIAITSENADSVVGNGISGLVKYEQGKQTLTLCNAAVQYIYSSMTDLLNIHIQGENKVLNEYLPAITSQGDLRITGPGRIFAACIERNDANCDVSVGGSLTISHNSIIEIYESIIIGDKLTIDNSILQVRTIHAGSTELIGCKQDCDNPIIICPENYYPQFNGHWFARMPITAYNADNIVSPFIINGNASYDYQTNTLILNGLTITEYFPSYDAIIDFSNYDLNIMLSSSNELWGKLICNNMTVSGKGSLYVNYIEGNAFEMSSLVLEGGCEFSSYASAQGDEVHINSLTVNKSTFRFDICINDLYVHNLILIDAAIEDNPNISYDPETGRFSEIVYDGTFPVVIISPTENTAISNVSDEKHNARDFYDMYGRRIADSTHPGIYIHGGKKIVVK